MESIWNQNTVDKIFSTQNQENKRQKISETSDKKVTHQKPKQEVNQAAMKHFEEEKKGSEFLKPKTVAIDAFHQKEDKNDGSFFRDRQ
jgi:deoxyinosine 3'endonuclease (endonuclease V)